MREAFFLPRSVRFSLLIAIWSIAALAPGAGAIAQSAGSWVVVDRVQPGQKAASPLLVAGAGKGDYVVIAQETPTIGPFVVRRTTDAGASWQRLRADSAAKMRVREVTHPTPALIVAVGDTAEVLGYDANFNAKLLYHAFILRSSDGGATWRRDPLPDSITISSVAIGADGSGAFISQKGTQPELRAFIHLTTDAGETWSVRPIPPSAGSMMKVVRCAPGSYVVTSFNATAQEYRINRTDDRGATWQSFSLPIAPEGLTFLDSLNGWMAGGVRTGPGDNRRDVIARTTDGGATWKTVVDSAIPPAFGLSAISFADREHGIAVGQHGKILRTRDGGLTWTQDAPPFDLLGSNANLLQVAYAAPDEALAVTGASGYVIRYTGRERLAPPVIVKPAQGQGLLPLETTVEWRKVTGATWYDLQIGDTTVEALAWTPHVFDVPYLDTTSLTDTVHIVHLQYGTHYTFRMRARSATDTSEWSAPLQMVSIFAPTSVETAVAGAGFSVRPMPARGSAVVTLQPGRPGPLRLHLADILGRDLGTLFNGWHDGGEERIPLDLSAAPAGTLYLVLERDGERSATMIRNVR